MGVQLDTNYFRSVPGIILGAEAVFGLVGGLINIFSFGLPSGLLGFLFWSTFSISGSLLVLNSVGVMQSLYDRSPVVGKAIIGYLVVWSVLYLIAAVLSFIGFVVSALIAYVELVIFIGDLVMRYRSTNSGSTAGATTATPGTAEQGGF